MTNSTDIRYERIGADYWLVLDQSDSRREPIGWVRERLVFEAGRYGQVRADRLWTSLEASRVWFAELTRGVHEGAAGSPLRRAG
ncbi:hypothetical protein N1027_12750 [Herbiconiux sp. CPCC 205763]|uniref:Uncharacterized protein n=1 Tax=Herbiconiux aconitum TaxID=2970913 RepID=A0ABT2GS03_9MICO|nr:hypothetical protein [Herbiconiux aconitum]MCS5719004.1 hypothetical protein [Herbiconiux aconitum]